MAKTMPVAELTPGEDPRNVFLGTDTTPEAPKAPVKVKWEAPCFILRSTKSKEQKQYRLAIMANKHWIKFDCPLNVPVDLNKHDFTDDEKKTILDHLKRVSTPIYEREYTGEFEKQPNGRNKLIYRIKQFQQTDGTYAPQLSNSPNYQLEKYVPIQANPDFDFEL